MKQFIQSLFTTNKKNKKKNLAKKALQLLNESKITPGSCYCTRVLSDTYSVCAIGALVVADKGDFEFLSFKSLPFFSKKELSDIEASYEGNLFTGAFGIHTKINEKKIKQITSYTRKERMEKILNYISETGTYDADICFKNSFYSDADICFKNSFYSAEYLNI